MQKYPSMYAPEQSREMIQEFRGYNHNLRCADNEFYDCENLTSAYYPVFSSRPARGGVRMFESFQGMIAKETLYTIENGRICYNGTQIPDGPLLNTQTEKTMVSMGAYIVIFPDKYYINTADTSDRGWLENTAPQSVLVSEQVSYQLCKMDGSSYNVSVTGPTPPTNASNGDLWLDTSGNISVLKQWSSTSSMWVPVATTYVKISYPGIGLGFSQYDGVTISGCAYSGDSEALGKQISELNGSHIIYAVDDDYIVIVGILNGDYEQTVTAQNYVKAERLVPDMDYVTEASNRIWGCKYGIVGGKFVNEIYCCALGDFKNWEKYEGVSTDAWRGSVGSDGNWTGAVTHLGHPIFFKEDRLHKVYISAEGAHQIVETQCRGVQEGSGKSLVVVNEVLYYKSRVDVCAYDGSLPVGVSDVFGEDKYYEGIGGTFGANYYLSLRDENGNYRLWVYDTKTNIWHRETIGQVKAMARLGDDLYIVVFSGQRYVLYKEFGPGTGDSTEGQVQWYAISGIQGYESPDHKYTSRYNLRMKMPRYSSCDLYLRYDEDPRWIHAGHMAGIGLRPFTLPIKPRRCDHWQWKIVGKGDVQIFSIAKVSEGGSDARHGYD